MNDKLAYCGLFEILILGNFGLFFKKVQNNP